jgi:hypothetical protein
MSRIMIVILICHRHKPVDSNDLSGQRRLGVRLPARPEPALGPILTESHWLR